MALSSLVSECNEDCGCSTTLYDPVCVDGIQYFTPCHAGCSQPAQIDDETGEKVLSTLFVSITIHLSTLCTCNMYVYFPLQRQ